MSFLLRIRCNPVGTLVDSSESWIEKHKVRTSVSCDLKMSHIGERHQLASVYIRVGWPPKRVSEKFRIYIFEQLHIVQYVIEQWTGMFYPRGGAIVSLPCTNLDSAAKRLKKSGLVVPQPGNLFGSSFWFLNT
jgi:hypothetical protein